MDQRAATVLQKLANLPPEIYARVAEVLVATFSGPSIDMSLRAVLPFKAKPAPAAPAHKPKARLKREPTTQVGIPSRAARVRELLMGEGPKTTAEIATRIGIPPTHIHPLLASIHAKPVGSAPDADGHEHKVYGFPGALIQDQAPGSQ